MHARPLEMLQVLDLEPAIAGATGDHYRAGADPLAVEEPQHAAVGTRLPFRLEIDSLVRDRHFGSELLGLIIGTRHQRHAGDSRREAQVVFDPGRSAGLTP